MTQLVIVGSIAGHIALALARANGHPDAEEYADRVVSLLPDDLAHASIDLTLAGEPAPAPAVPVDHIEPAPAPAAEQPAAPSEAEQLPPPPVAEAPAADPTPEHQPEA